MPDESLRREQARRALDLGKLPRGLPHRTWGGPGVNTICAVCDEPISPNDVEYEVEFVKDGNVAGVEKFHFHLRCFAAWEFERTQPENNRHG